MTAAGVGRNVIRGCNGKIQCTNCKAFHELELFPLRSNRGRKIRSRWCRDCLKYYQQGYYALTGVTTPYRGYHRKENKLSMEKVKSILEDPRKGLAVAIAHGVSLSTVYRVKAARRFA